MNQLHFDTDKDLEKWLQKTKKASGSTQVKRKSIKPTDDCVNRLEAKIKCLEKANERFMKKYMELQANYDGLMIAYKLLEDTSNAKSKDYRKVEKQNGK